LNSAIALDRNRREPYLYRFLSNVELGNGDQGDDDLDRVSSFYPDRFDANLAIVRLHFMQERFGSAELALAKTESLAKTDEQEALIYYWSGLVYEERNNPRKAVEYWQKLLALPEDAMTEEMRTEAQEHLSAIRTPTPTATPKGKTPTPTRTRTPTRTPSPTRTPTRTPTK
jgi:tetratricopeptide (TPR) repeat protein